MLFSVEVYEQVVEAYIGGLEDLARGGGDVAKIGSVASFFVSRIDTAVDKRLDKLDDKAVAARLRGKVAIANAKQAYTRYQKLFSGARWEKLAAAGAKTQRLLWASTSTKDPSLQRHIVCRGADRSRHRRHNTAGNHGCIPRSR